MTLKIKTPPSLPMPEAGYLGDDASYGYDQSDMAAQLAARDVQWLELVGPVVKALADALESVVDYRHGIEFGTSDDEAITNGRAALRAITEEQK